MPRLTLAAALLFAATVTGGLRPPLAVADEPLHVRIDALVAAGRTGTAPAADDAEFLRRVTLDLAGTIPTADEARSFLADTAADKRAKLVDRLLASPEHARRMADAFHVALMERRADDAAWAKYLLDSFAADKPLDAIARDVLNPAGAGEAGKAASFFYAKRLEAGDPTLIPRDVGRLFLGKDLRCAQCHDHVHIDEYKQLDFQGLAAFFQGVTKAGPVGVAEKPPVKVQFASVFKKQPKETWPRLPGGTELDVPAFAPGEEFAVKPDPKKAEPGVPKFSPLARLAEQVPAADAFARNAANRLWAMMLGRGLVHPLDLHHADNPPSHPALLDLLARELADRKFRHRELLREIALSGTYQRAGTLPGGGPAKPEAYRAALEKRLSAEQFLAALLAATGETPPADAKEADALRQRFVKAFAAPPGEPEDDHGPSLAGALLVLNGKDVQDRLTPKPGNLVDRLSGTDKDADAVEELYLSVLTRRPTDEERASAEAYLAKRADRRPAALGRLAWSLLASAEFAVSH